VLIITYAFLSCHMDVISETMAVPVSSCQLLSAIVSCVKESDLKTMCDGLVSTVLRTLASEFQTAGADRQKLC